MPRAASNANENKTMQPATQPTAAPAPSREAPANAYQRIAVVGLGYIGLPTAAILASRGGCSHSMMLFVSHRFLWDCIFS